jgi:hypothetical protein
MFTIFNRQGNANQSQIGSPSHTNHNGDLSRKYTIINTGENVWVRETYALFQDCKLV